MSTAWALPDALPSPPNANQEPAAAGACGVEGPPSLKGPWFQSPAHPLKLFRLFPFWYPSSKKSMVTEEAKVEPDPVQLPHAIERCAGEDSVSMKRSLQSQSGHTIAARSRLIVFWSWRSDLISKKGLKRNQEMLERRCSKLLQKPGAVCQ